MSIGIIYNAINLITHLGANNPRQLSNQNGEGVQRIWHGDLVPRAMCGQKTVVVKCLFTLERFQRLPRKSLRFLLTLK